MRAPSHLASSLAQDGLHTPVPILSLNNVCMGGLWLSRTQVSCTYVCVKFDYFLLLICLMSVWLLGLGGSLFLPRSAKVLPQHSAFVVNSWVSRLMMEDGAIDKPQKGSSQKSICIWLGINHLLWKECPISVHCMLLKWFSVPWIQAVRQAGCNQGEHSG